MLSEKETQMESNKPKHPNQGASFIMLVGRDFPKQPEIPQEFALIFQGHVPCRFIIEDTLAKKCWRVEVKDDADGTLYFQEGWAEFVKAHSLDVGDLLLFEYEEPSIFQVKVYGCNGCQKAVAMDNKASQCNPSKIVKSRDEEASKPLGLKSKIDEKRQQKTKILSTRTYSNKRYKKLNAVSWAHRTSSRVSVGANRKSFSITLHKTKKYQFTQLAIPKAVTREKNLESKDEVVLQDAKGNSWPVKLGHKRDGHAILLGGWKRFLDENKVRGGDKLNFEFVSDRLAQVYVIRAAFVEHHLDEAHCQNEATEDLDLDCQHVERLSNYATKNQTAEASVNYNGGSSEPQTSFSLTWNKHKALTYLYLPKAVAAEQKLMDKESIVLRDSEGKCWPLQVKKLPDGRVAINKGWSEFWKEHALQAGDSLNFQFVSRCLIQVKINRVKPLETAEEVIIDSKEINNRRIACDLLAEHDLLQVPPGFKPKEPQLL